MDKGKNRTDLLAAGRKKLQQFRKKKDHKGSSNHAKSSSKSGKHDMDEGEESNSAVDIEIDTGDGDPSNSETEAQPVDSSTVPLEEGKDEETLTDGGETRLTAEFSSGAMQEAINSISEHYDIDSHVDVPSNADVMLEDHTMTMTIPHSKLEGVLEASNSQTPIEGNHGGEMGSASPENEWDGQHVTVENEGVENELSIPYEANHEAVASFPKESEEHTSQNELSEIISSSIREDSASIREEGAQVVDTEEKCETNEEGSMPQTSLGVDAINVNFESEPMEKILKEGLLETKFADELDILWTHLYLTNITKEYLQLQLAQQVELNAVLHHNSSSEVSNLLGFVKETQESKAMVSKELENCRSELQAIATQKGELENQRLSTEEEMKELRERAVELQDRLEWFQEELTHVSEDLANCRESQESLQKENLNLAEKSTVEADARRKLLEEKELLSIANMGLASELSEQKESLIIALIRQTQLEDKLTETGAWFEDLVGENLYLSNNLVIHETKLKELDCGHYESHFQYREFGYQVDHPRFEPANTEYAAEIQTICENGDMQAPLLQNDDVADSASSALLGVLKRNLETANHMVGNLEKSIQGMHSHSVSLSRAGGKTAAPGVSKLIQAFESKTHLADHVPDTVPLTEGGQLEDSYTLASQQACNLKDILKQMFFDVGNAEIHIKEEENNRKSSEQLKMDFEALREQNNILQIKMNILVGELSDYKPRIDDLQDCVKKIQESANDEAGTFLGEVEVLQNKVNEMASAFKQERESVRGVIFETIESLNASTGLLVPENIDIGSFVSSSVETATTIIKSLHEKHEEAHLNYNMLHNSFKDLSKMYADTKEKKELAIELLSKFYVRLKELANNTCQNAEEETVIVNSEEVLQLLPEKFEMLVGHLLGLLGERLHFLSITNKLESELLGKNQDIEHLDMRCNSLSKELECQCHAKVVLESTLVDKIAKIEEFNGRCLFLTKKLQGHDLRQHLDSVPGLAEDGSVFNESDKMESDLCEVLLSRLEALVDFHLEQYEEAIEQINLSKNYLKEVSLIPETSSNTSSMPLLALLQQEFVPKMSDLQENLHKLITSNLQQENEMKNLREGLGKMEEALDSSRSELHMKESELEQSEQRFLSVREKLSIAVTKGKGLIVQRDGLKQSLMEKSSELEKSTQELLSTKALLHEVEAKLKSCSEVERVEALESELSYIRNSANALRDSFLLKDSVLQKIEEILEDFDFPEHFHSKEIVEKIELLARSAVSNPSVTIADWDQKSSDTGFMVTDAWRDDLPPSSNHECDELKRKYEELQSKLYSLAEHNDMLEQSLLERNNHVQKLEEILNEIDMPPQLRTLDLKDRIEWLKTVLSEIQQERNSLQLKIENLEVSSDMLIVDLEESHKKISELNAEVAAVKSDKEFFVDSLGKLRYEYFGLSEKVVQDDIDRDNLQRELADLQGKNVYDTEKEIQRLNEFLVNALPDSEMFDSSSGGSGTEHLEELLKKLIENYTSLSIEKSMHRDSWKELVSEDNILSLDKAASEDVLDDKEQDLVALRSELDEALLKLASLKEEKDAAVDKCHSLMLEVETISYQRNLLQEEKSGYADKYQSLVLELDTIVKQRDSVQEQLFQEEQKTASVREKLNIAVRKGKLLVQQRDSLKQTIEEMNTTVENLKFEHSRHVEALDSEKSLLMNQLAETEQSFQENSQTLSQLLTALHGIDVGGQVNILDPVQKMEGIGRLCHELNSAVVFSDHEAKKSKQAAELLLAELNEVQEQSDVLQEKLAKAEAAKSDVHSRFEQFISLHSDERKKQIDSLVELKSGIDQLKKCCFYFSSHLSDVLNKDVDVLCYLEAFMESMLKQMSGENFSELTVLASSSLECANSVSEESFLPFGDDSVIKEHFNDSSISEHIALASSSLHECMRVYDVVKENFQKHSYFIGQKAAGLVKIRENVQRKISSQKDFSESLSRSLSGLEFMLKEKETEVFSLRRNIALLYEACSCSIMEIENRKASVDESGLARGEHVLGKTSTVLKSPSYVDVKENTGQIFAITDDCVKMMADTLLSAVKGSSNTNEIVQDKQKELKAAIEDLQKELQEKDVHTNRICSELVSQKREAEAVAKINVMDLDSARAQVINLEKQVEVMNNDRKLLELRVNELIDCEASSKKLQERTKSLSDELSAKDQEIEALMQALDEEESQMEGMENRNNELESIIQEKDLALESLEVSRSKALAKLANTMSRFDELHNLSESLVAEIESLQSQVHDQDSEISFLRQEVTRRTNDILASQETNKKYSAEIHELLTWMDMMVSRYGLSSVSFIDQEGSKVRACIDIVEKKIESVVAELSDLRMKSESKDDLLQIERGRVEELLCKAEVLEASLHENETQVQQFRSRTDSVQAASMSSPGPLEIEHVSNKAVFGPIKTHVRGGRKVNNDQIAIAIDTEKDDHILNDEDDDKAHGFKSLNMSRVVPRSIRPVADRIDMIWVSGERLLMRQPTLRLGLLIYWVSLHVLLASVI